MSQTVRAKFRCVSVKHDTYSREAELTAVTDDGIPENQRFYEATPSGKITIYVTNKNVHDFYTPGKSYYVDFTPAED